MSRPRAWPEDWPEMMAGRGCAMCANQGAQDNGFGVRIHEGEFADVFLQRADMCRGYSVAIWKHGHVADLTNLGDDGVAGYTLDTVRAARRIERPFTPRK